MKLYNNASLHNNTSRIVYNLCITIHSPVKKALGSSKWVFYNNIFQNNKSVNYIHIYVDVSIVLINPRNNSLFKKNDWNKIYPVIPVSIGVTLRSLDYLIIVTRSDERKRILFHLSRMINNRLDELKLDTLCVNKYKLKFSGKCYIRRNIVPTVSKVLSNKKNKKKKFGRG